MKYTIVLFFLLLGVRALAQTVTIAGNTTNFDITGKTSVSTLKIPIKADPAVLSGIRFPQHNPAFVQLGTNNDSKFTRAISFSYDPVAAVLEVKVNADSLYLQGTYGVSLLYQAGKAAAPNYLSFNLVKPAAVLESLNTITITKIGGEIKYDPVFLHETGNKTAIRDLKFSAPYLPGVNTEGLIAFKAPMPVLDAGEQRSVFYTVNTSKLNEVPLGISTGKLYLNSNSLAAPLSISFVVTRKLWPGWIILTVLIGLMVSYLVKQVLSVRKDNEGLRLSAFQLIADMIAFSKSTPDQTFLDRINVCIQAVETIINQSNQVNSQDITQSLAAVQTQRAAFSQIQLDFYNALSTQRQAFNDRKNALYAANTLPAVLWYLKPAQALLPGIFQNIETDKNPAAAAAGLQDLDQAIETAVALYKSYFGSLQTLLSVQGSYPGKALTTYTAATSKIGTIAQALSAIDLTDHVQAIARLNAQQQLLEAIPGGLRDNLKSDFAAIGIQLENQAALKALTAGWLNSFTNILTNPENAPDASHYDIGAAAAQIDIAVTVINQPSPEIPMANDIEGFGPQSLTEQILQVVPDANLITAPDANPIIPPDFRFSAVGGPKDIGAALQAVKDRYWVYSLLQTGVLALLISLGAYSSLQSTFVGLPVDFIGIFLLAFSMDIVVANVNQFKAKGS
jgi:hypothetical protein